MTKLPTILFSTAFALAVGIAGYQGFRAYHLGEDLQRNLRQQSSMAKQNEQLQSERDALQARLAAVQPADPQAHEDLSKLVKLRAAVTQLRGDSQELAQMKAAAALRSSDPAESEMKSWLDRVHSIKQMLQLQPQQQIPELKLLSDKAWLGAVKDIGELKTDTDFGQALTSLRTAAKNEFASRFQNAMRNYQQAGNSELPADWSQLKAYFDPPVEDALLRRYAFTQPGTVAETSSPLGDQDDNYFQISMNSINTSSLAEITLEPAVQAFSAANHGQAPSDPSQLAPYLKTPAERAALQSLSRASGQK